MSVDKERYNEGTTTSTEEDQKKVLLKLSSLFSKLEQQPKRTRRLLSHKSLVVRILIAGLVGLVAFAFASSQYYTAPLLTKNQVKASEHGKGNGIHSHKRDHDDVDVDHGAVYTLAEKKSMLQKRARQWLLLVSSSNHIGNGTLNDHNSNLMYHRLQPPNTPGAFIHVGKTGGSTLSSQLRNACHSWVRKPCNVNITTTNHESIVSKLTTYYHLPDFRSLAERIQNETMNQNHHPASHDVDDDDAPPYEFYVWTVRDPLERTISAFLYQHPSNIKVRKAKFWKRLKKQGAAAFACFPTLESFTTALGGDGDGNDDDPLDYDYPFDARTVNNTNCTRLARAIMDNTVTVPAHLYYSFNWLREQHILPGPRPPTRNDDDDSYTINDAIHLAIRTEHLWDDWITANQWLGQDTVATFPDIQLRKQDVPEIHYPVKRELSVKGQERLCRALKNEYQAYLHLLQQAVNLSDEQRQDSLDLARRNCPSLSLQFHTAL